MVDRNDDAGYHHQITTTCVSLMKCSLCALTGGGVNRGKDPTIPSSKRRDYNQEAGVGASQCSTNLGHQTRSF